LYQKISSGKTAAAKRFFEDKAIHHFFIADIFPDKFLEYVLGQCHTHDVFYSHKAARLTQGSSTSRHLCKFHNQEGGETMAVISKPLSARLRFMNSAEESVQSLSRINPNLQASDMQVIRQAINAIRIVNQPAAGGLYTITNELTEA